MGGSSDLAADSLAQGKRQALEGHLVQFDDSAHDLSEQHDQRYHAPRGHSSWGTHISSQSCEPAGVHCWHAHDRNSHKKQRVAAWAAALMQLPPMQHHVHRLLCLALWAPAAMVLAGVMMPRESKNATQNLCPANSPCSVLYLSYVQCALLFVYVLLTNGAAVLFYAHFFPCLKGHKGAVWKPRDMLFFVCKILGSTINIVLGTLVGGSFVDAMSMELFWACMVLSVLSFTATDLLYDLGDPPVAGLWKHRPPAWLAGQPAAAAAPPAAGGAGGAQACTRAETPPFLQYNKPAGARGWGIVVLLMSLVGPGGWILYALAHGLPAVVPANDASCGGDSVCATRYMHLLYCLSSLAILASYYAFTVGVVGFGPVSILYLLPRALLSKCRGWAP